MKRHPYKKDPKRDLYLENHPSDCKGHQQPGLESLQGPNRCSDPIGDHHRLQAR